MITLETGTKAYPIEACIAQYLNRQPWVKSALIMFGLTCGVDAVRKLAPEGKARTISGRAMDWMRIATGLRLISVLNEARMWCHDEKCMKFVPKIDIPRSKWSLMYWLDGPSCKECPPGSEEVTPDAGGEVWRKEGLFDPPPQWKGQK